MKFVASGPLGQRAVRLLTERGPMTARQIADELGFPPSRSATSSVAAAMTVLKALGRVTHDSRGGGVFWAAVPIS